MEEGAASSRRALAAPLLALLLLVQLAAPAEAQVGATVTFTVSLPGWKMAKYQSKGNQVYTYIMRAAAKAGKNPVVRLGQARSKGGISIPVTVTLTGTGAGTKLRSALLSKAKPALPASVFGAAAVTGVKVAVLQSTCMRPERCLARGTQTCISAPRTYSVPLGGACCDANHCSVGECVSGMGKCQCPAGKKACNGQCIDAAECCNGQCDGGTTCCGSRCVDLQTEESNCGSCGNDCSRGIRNVCDAGTCSFPSPRAVIDNTNSLQSAIAPMQPGMCTGVNYHTNSLAIIFKSDLPARLSSATMALIGFLNTATYKVTLELYSVDWVANPWAGGGGKWIPSSGGVLQRATVQQRLEGTSESCANAGAQYVTVPFDGLWPLAAGRTYALVLTALPDVLFFAPQGAGFASPPASDGFSYITVAKYDPDDPVPCWVAPPVNLWPPAIRLNSK